MIDRILGRWLIKRIASERMQNYSTNNAGIYNLFISWLFGLWFGLGLLISYIAYEYGLDTYQCNLCNRIVEIIPTIDVAAGKSDFPNVMRIIWLYLTITTPLVAVALILTAPFMPYKEPPTSFKKLFMSWLVCAVFLLIAYTYIFIWGGPSIAGKTKMAKIFMHTIFGGYFISFSAFCMLPLSLFISIFQHINFFSTK